MPSFFCSCGFANEFVFNKPDYCGKCRKSLANLAVASRPKRRVVVEEDIEDDEEEEVEIVRRPKKKIVTRQIEDEDDENEIEIEGIDLNNIKISIAATPRDRYKLDENFMKSNTDSYVPPPRQGSSVDIREDIARRSQETRVNIPEPR